MDKLMNFNDAKKYLKTSRATLYRLIHTRKIPAFKVGGSWRFKRNSVDKWLDELENTNNKKERRE